MSVQAGTWNLDEEPATKGMVAKIGSHVAEYGPDGESISVDGPVAMLYRPFHTTADSRRESQPYRLNNGTLITWDGRLDNRIELAAELELDRPLATIDVAIIGAAFEEWGTECFQRLIGDWALCIWNPEKKELILARDYIGARQLFYYVRRNNVVWSSHLVSLALFGDQLTVCDEYVAGYLAFQPEAHLTPYEQIRSVPPATFVVIHDSKPVVHRYWACNREHRIRYRKDAEYKEHFRHLFRQSVRRRLRTDSPMLATLSGGYDSTSILCMADDILAKEGAEAPRVDTFSYYDSSDPNDDDLLYFTKAEEHRGRKGFHLDLASSGDSLSLDYSMFAAAPGFGSRSEVKAGLAEALRSYEYRVLLSGSGGDEMNGQALDPRIQLADLLIHFQFSKLLPQLRDWSLLMRRPWFQLLGDTLLELMPLTIRARLRTRGQLEPWIDHNFARQHHLSNRQMEEVKGVWFYRPAVRDSVQTIATLSRRMTSASPGLYEQRSPYLDQQLVEFLTAIPLDQLLRPGHRRVLMRGALEDLLPAETLTRRTKSTGSRFYCVTLQKHWSELEQILDRPLVSQLGYVVRDQLHAALFMMRNGQIPAHPVRLLKVLSLELWLRTAVDRGVVALRERRAIDGIELRNTEAA
jgi:asparagine synthase (glutamine-hydrolysing)